MPAQPTTKELERVVAPRTQLDELIAISKGTASDVRALRFDTADKFVEVGTMMSQFRDELAEFRVELSHVKRSQDSSIRPGLLRASQADATHDAAIAKILEKQTVVDGKIDALAQATDAQTVMLTKAESAAKALWADPKFRVVLGALWAAFLYWLGTKGIKVP